jgi:serine/threonine protein kinase
MSPELAQKKEHLGGPADIWALGVILFILLTGKMPFYGAFEEDLYRKIEKGKYQWPDFLTDKKGDLVELSSGAKALVKKIFNPNQKNRPTATQILTDPWLSKLKPE